MISPSISFLFVGALNCLQNSMMLICACPSAGPTGGAGVALPAAICNFTKPVTFFAMISLPPAVRVYDFRLNNPLNFVSRHVPSRAKPVFYYALLRRSFKPRPVKTRLANSLDETAKALRHFLH